VSLSRAHLLWESHPPPPSSSPSPFSLAERSVVPARRPVDFVSAVPAHTATSFAPRASLRSFDDAPLCAATPVSRPSAAIDRSIAGKLFSRVFTDRRRVHRPRFRPIDRSIDRSRSTLLASRSANEEARAFTNGRRKRSVWVVSRERGKEGENERRGWGTKNSDIRTQHTNLYMYKQYQSREAPTENDTR